MRLNFCCRCGETFEFDKVSRKISLDIKLEQLKPNIREEYYYQCRKCEHYQHVVDTNYEEPVVVE